MAKKKKQKHNSPLSIPEGFIQRLNDMVGYSLALQIEKTFVERLTTFRINTLRLPEHLSTRAPKHFIIETLENSGFKVKKVSWYPDAFILLNKSKRELMELPIYTDGKIYIQSLASMVPPLVLDPKPGEKVLDLTAAPGSKTSQIAALMQQQGELVANDNNKVRFFKLKHNMEMLGVTHESSGWTFTLRMEDGGRLCGEYNEYFDKILLDAPCSAEARFVQGEPKTYGYWSERKIKEMAYKQRKLLLSAWQALRPGGTLVYSTCTFAPEENESLISLVTERFPDSVEVLPIDIPGLKVLSPVKGWKGRLFQNDVQKTVRICPTGEIEGFFVAKLRKK